MSGQILDAFEGRDFLPFYERRRAIVRARLATLLGARPDEIRETATEMPAAAPLPAPEATPPAAIASAHTFEASHASTGKTKRFYATSLKDLVTRGALSAGAVLSRQYRGANYEVVVRPDGRLEADGDVFESPSQAARLLTGQKAVNGWAFWLTESGVAVGALRPGNGLG